MFQKKLGGDASENGDFQRGKQRLVWCKIFTSPNFEDHKMAILLDELNLKCFSTQTIDGGCFGKF